MKKAIKIIAIILALCVLAVIVLFGVFKFNTTAADQKIEEIEEQIEERTDLDGNWDICKDASLDIKEICALDIVWNCGDVSIDETEGSEISVDSNKADAIEYQVKSGTLYISNNEKYENESAKLKILIPEELIMKLVALNIVTSAGDVNVDSEEFAEIDIVTASGNIFIDENDAMKLNLVSSSGNVRVNTDDDDAFVLNYSSASGDVSVDFDRNFKNESVKGSEASYDHSLGNSICTQITAVTASGDIKLVDD